MLHAERAALPAVAPGPKAALTLAMARERAEHGDRPAALALAEEARGLARVAGDRALEADAAVAVADAAHCRLRRDDPRALADVDRRIAEAGALVDGLGDEAVAPRLQMLLWLGVARLFTGRFPAGHAAADRGLRVARATRQGVLAPAFLLLRSFADEEMGRLDDAEAGAEESLDSALISGNAQVAFFASAVLSWCALARGQVDDAIRHGVAIWQHNKPSVYGQAGYSVADARLAAGDPEGALDALETYGWIRPEMWTLDRVKGLEVIVRVLLALGRVDEAADWAARAPLEGGGRRSGVFGALAASAGAHVLLARGDAASAAGLALQGAVDAQAGRAPVWAARCRALAGRALIETGEVDAAREELRRATAELEACGAWGFRDAALQDLRRLGDRPGQGAPAAAGHAEGSPGALTPREREVATLMAGGDTNAQIALRLRLSERTVEKHASRVLAKLGVPTRAGVVRLLAAGEDAPGRWTVPALRAR
jgi:DNA-binding CsgD family transcriptional regulator